MKAVVGTKSLKRAVKSAVSVLVKKPSHIEHEAVILKVKDGMLYVGVMGDDIMVVSSLRAAGAEDGSVATRAKAFHELLKNESSATVTLNTVDRNLHVCANLVDHKMYSMYVDLTVLKVLSANSKRASRSSKILQGSSPVSTGG
jgi:DNA polymerase III sliding clamp (beta) subunit (PCNA family)